MNENGYKYERWSVQTALLGLCSVPKWGVRGSMRMMAVQRQQKNIVVVKPSPKEEVP
jgi:hypothetical protein